VGDSAPASWERPDVTGAAEVVVRSSPLGTTCTLTLAVRVSGWASVPLPRLLGALQADAEERLRRAVADATEREGA
jgi:hypothetical protein